MVDLINADRAASGLAPVQADSRLMEVAHWRSEDMVARNYFSHDIGGILVSKVMRDRQIPFKLVGENLAFNTFDESNTVAIAESGLMASRGHRANILRPEFNQLGVGVAVAADGRVVFTQIFVQA